MVAIVIFIAILTITIAAVGPSISTMMRREREEELLFRGKQYARAIALFRKRYGRYPTSLKEMYEHRPRTIRKLWKDPMCGCDDWKLLIDGRPDSTPFMDERVDPSNRPPSTYTGLRPTPTPGIGGSGGEIPLTVRKAYISCGRGRWLFHHVGNGPANWLVSCHR